MKDILTALENWRKLLVVQSDADISDPAVKKNIDTIEKNAQRSLEMFKRDAKDSLFLGKMPETTHEMSVEYNRIYDIAKSFGSYGTKHYNDKGVLEIILYCLDWMYENRYGQKEIDGCGWRDMRLFNWYQWDIACPSSIINILVILGDICTPDDALRYLKVFDKRVPVPRDYGSNKMHFGKLIIGAGLLQRNEEKIWMSLKALEDTHIYVDGWKNDGQGFYTDGSYIFHTRHPMNGTYAVGHYAALTEICKILTGTKFSDDEIINRICRWTVDSFIPFITKTVITRSVLGRHPVGGVNTATSILANACEVAAIADEENRECILEHVKRNLLSSEAMKNPETLNAFYGRLSNNAYKLIKAAVEDNKAVKAYNINKVFHNEDRVMHHYEGVVYSLAISSSRIYNYECINHENMEGWYFGDGMLTSYGSDYYAYTSPYYEKADPYRRPGTTLDLREREKVSISQRNEYLSSQDFVGGVSDGKCGAAAMRLESYHSDGEHVSKRYYSPNGAYGGPPPKRECSLLAKKSWFFYQKTAVALGADISAQDNAEVITVVDYRKTDKDIKVIGGSVVEAFEKDVWLDQGIKGLYLDGFGGYYFPENNNLTVKKSNKDGTGFVEIVARHGIDPENQGYAYALLTDATEKEAEAYVNAPNFSVLSNNKDVQAVQFENGTKMYVFWSAGEFDGVSVSAPAMVMTDGKKLYVSDPTQKLTELTITFCGKEYKFDVTDKYGATLSADI